MKFQKIWWVWFLIILVLILIFPKTCGRTDYVSSAIEYSCKGIEAPFFSNINDKYNWCYGICFETLIRNETEQLNQTVQEGPSFILEISKSIRNVIFPLFIIFIAIAFIKFISSLKTKKSNVTVVKKLD